MKANLPTRQEWEEAGFTAPDDLCSQPTSLQAIQPLLREIHGTEPPIAAQELVQRRLRDLRLEEKELMELLSTNRALQAQYEAKIVPF